MITPQRDHAVPCAVGLKVAGDRIGGVGHRMSALKSPEIGNNGRSVIRVCGRPRWECWERDVGNSTGKTAGLAGWQVVDEGGNVAVGIDP